MTRGPTDAEGLRTVFSNHSFGVALDVNAELNGLYDRCIDGEALEYDRERTAYLNALHIKVLRFLNTEVYADPVGVCERILEEIEKRDPTTPGPS